MNNKEQKTSNLTSKYKQVKHFLSKGIWEINNQECSILASLGIRAIKTIKIAIHGFFNDKLQLRASALTFYSALSIVPIIAILLGLAQGFGMKSLVENTLMDSFPAQKEVLTHIIKFSENSLNHAQGAFFGIGIVFLLWAVMNLFGQIELSFNEIWQVKRRRTFIRQFTDYMGLILIFPIFMILSSTITVILRTKLEGMSVDSSLDQLINPLGVFLVQAGPYIINCIIFTLMFLIMPNRRIQFLPACIAGIFTGVLFQLLQTLFISGQVWLTSYSATYGSFSALPLFLLLMQLSWIITLIGAELSFAIQNVGEFELENDLSDLSHNYQSKVAILISAAVVQNFLSGEQQLSAKKIAEQQHLPLRVVNEITAQLVDAGVLSEVLRSNQENSFQPAVAPELLTIRYIAEKMDTLGKNSIHWNPNTQQYLTLLEKLEEITKHSQNAPANILVKDL